MTAKEELISKIKELPDDASTVRIREEIELALQEKEILAAIEEGYADVAAGRTKTIDQVQAQLHAWAAEWEK
jgi:predicted transcriptional regulator